MVTAAPINFKEIRFPELRRKAGRPVSHLGQAAEALGVCYSHLSRVVKGQRQSPELIARYRAWCAAAGQPCACD